jgi:hypothetical protein
MENVYNMLKTNVINIERNVVKNSCRKCKLRGDEIKKFVKTERKDSKTQYKINQKHSIGHETNSILFKDAKYF